jgi:EAL domain-containing protein (putative c-di-GMP-specific phosphodiesterase class I)
MPLSDALSVPILVVDDDAFQRRALVRLLKTIGAQTVSEAEDGAQALALLAQSDAPRWLVLCDLDMPTLDGLGLLRRLSEIRAEVAVALCSAHDRDLLRAVRMLAEDHGVSMIGVLPKPIGIEQLRGLMAGALWHTRQPPRPPAVHLSADELAQALDARWVEPFFQPKVSLADGMPIGCESLVRIVDPQRGVMTPASFLGAMQAGQLEHRVLECVVEHAAQLLVQLGGVWPDFVVAVNASLTLVTDDARCEQLLATVERYRVSPGRLIVEVTENAASEHAERAVENLARLRMRGVRLSIDDFGTGYSSLEQLLRLPFSELKLDLAFVQRATRDDVSLAVVESVIAMAHRLGLNTVAEGIENETMRRTMQDLGCRYGQGYLFGRPMRLPDFLSWMREMQARRAAA